MTDSSEPQKPSARLFGGNRAQAYEERVRQVVPGYDALHDLSYLHLNRRIGRAGHFLIAGCGSGHDVISLARDCPERHFTAFDPSPDMVEMARCNIEAAAITPRCHLLEGTIDDVANDHTFDAATLMLVMHFVPDTDGPDGKAHLLNALSQRLKPGAPLVFAEALADRSSNHFEDDLNLWRQSMLLSGMNPVEEEKGFHKIVSRMPLIGEDRLRHLLETAGFNAPELFYQAHLIHGWVVTKQ